MDVPRGRRVRLEQTGDVPAPRPPGPGEEPGPGTDPDVDPPAEPGPLPPLPHPRTDPVPPAPDLVDGLADDLRAAYGRARTALGFPEPPALLEQRIAIAVDVDRSRAVRCARHCTQWTAVRATEAFGAVTLARVPTAGGRPVREWTEVEAVRGCRTGAGYTDVRAGLSATRMELDAPVAAGERVETVHRVIWVDEERVPPATEYAHRLPASFSAACIEVRFAQRRVPVRGEGFVRWGDGHPGQDEEVVPLTVATGQQGPVLRHRCGPHVRLDELPDGHDRAGTVVVGVRWTW